MAQAMLDTACCLGRTWSMIGWTSVASQTEAAPYMIIATSATRNRPR